MKFDELDRKQQLYIQRQMDAVGVDPRMVDPAAIDQMLENYQPDESWFDRAWRANEVVSAYNRERAEKAGPLPTALPSEVDVKDFAKRFGVVPSLVRTQEMADAEELAEQQRQQFEKASTDKDTWTLTRIGDDPDHPYRQAARDRVAEYFPSYDLWHT